MSYGLTVNVLQEVLPLDHVLAASSIRHQVTTLGCRPEAEQITDARQQAEVAASVGLPEIPESSPVRAVGIDGDYIRRAGHRRHDGWFQVIVGKSMRDQDAGHSFAYAQAGAPTGRSYVELPAARRCATQSAGHVPVGRRGYRTVCPTRLW
ncbi:hypothetical protein KAF44_22660 (plasmid) [Cupriavidus necator]|nr:hypothetical protein KAF44_22660 [Cupriavidus necator]